ncbi:hypothetical protein OHC33_011222, partial [Knufia fluminis]
MACSTTDHLVDDIDHVRADRTTLSDQPPTLQPFDVQLQQMKVSTFALGLQPGVIAGQKRVPRPPYEQRLVEIIRDKASLTREVRFFRTVYQATEEMRDRIRSVVQDLTLHYYVRPNEAGDADRAWLQLADELDFALLDYAHVVELAAQDWM